MDIWVAQDDININNMNAEVLCVHTDFEDIKKEVERCFESSIEPHETTKWVRIDEYTYKYVLIDLDNEMDIALITKHTIHN